MAPDTFIRGYAYARSEKACRKAEAALTDTAAWTKCVGPYTLRLVRHAPLVMFIGVTAVGTVTRRHGCVRCQTRGVHGKGKT